MAVTELDSRVAAIAVQEWWFFGSLFVDGENPAANKQQAPGGHGFVGDETDMGFKQRVWTYFKFGVFPTSNGWQGLKNDPWSAAFISFCMRAGGAGQQFPYGASHSTYVTQAVRNRLAGDKLNVVVAYDVDEIAPTPGDLLWKGRKGNDDEIDTTNWTYDDVIAHVKRGGGGFPSHCDLVVSVDLPGKRLYTIGGNVEDTVLRLKVPLDENGMLLSQRFKMILQNNISESA